MARHSFYRFRVCFLPEGRPGERSPCREVQWTFLTAAQKKPLPTPLVFLLPPPRKGPPVLLGPDPPFPLSANARGTACRAEPTTLGAPAFLDLNPISDMHTEGRGMQFCGLMRLGPFPAGGLSASGVRL